MLGNAEFITVVFIDLKTVYRTMLKHVLALPQIQVVTFESASNKNAFIC
jgi:hypothetical protein